MSRLSRLIEVLISRAKGDPNYRLNSEYTTTDMLGVLWYRGLQVLRGLRHRWSLGACEGLVFCGRGVVVEFGGRIKAGRALILEDGVFLNALSRSGIRFGRNVTVGRRSVLICTGVIAKRGEGIQVGNNSAVGAHSFLGGQGGIVIGRDVIMGPGVRIFSEDHEFDSLTVPIRKQGETRQGVVIEDNCWIGAGVTIVDGVTIGQGSVVAAGAVVTRSLPQNSVAAGVPARMIRTRGRR